MNKIYKPIVLCCLLNLLSSAYLISQPVLTAANFNPVPGDIIIFRGVTPSFGLPITNGGVAQTWDVSAYTGTASYSANCFSASSTPYAATYPAANISFFGSGQNQYDYYITNANEFLWAGYYPSGGPAKVNTDNQTLMTYPFTYTDTFFDTFASSDGITYTTGYDSASADGYGTLILPYGSITGCLKVQCIIREVDSSSSSMDTIAYQEYQWFKPGIHIPVGDYIVFNTAFGLFYNWRYADQSVVGMENLFSNENNISVCPNPFTNEIAIAVKGQNNKQATIEIKNILGESVVTFQEDNLHSPFNKTIDLSFLSKGIYFLFADMGGKRSIKRILKE